MCKNIWDFLAARYVMAVLASIGFAIVYGLKVNLSVAIVGMVNHTALGRSLEPDYMKWPLVPQLMRGANIKNFTLADSHRLKLQRETKLDECEGDDTNDTTAEDGPFLWTGKIQGALLSSYFWGYIVSQLPGGRLAELFSAKWVMFFAIAVNIVGTILSPEAAKLHYGALLVIRIATGIGAGVTFPAMHVMLAHWAPPTERGTMSSIVYSGTAIGTVVFTMVTGVIAAKLGWEAIFYIEGIASSGWLLFWFFLVEDTPEKQKFISEKERDMINASLHRGGGGEQGREKKLPVPWKAVMTSPPLLAIMVANVCSDWGWYVILIELPFYMKSVLKFKIASSAMLTAIPYFSMWIFSMILSKILDHLQATEKITTTTERKIATLIASVIPAFCFIVLGYIGCKPTLAVILMTVIVTLMGGMFPGFLSNHIDIAPNFAGTLMALTNTIATVCGIITPIFVGHLIETDPSITSWRIIFWVTVCFYVVEIIVYTIFATAEEQPWNNP